MINSASNLVRLVVSGDEEVSYWSQADAGVIYEGKGKLKDISGYNSVRHFKDGWTLEVYGGVVVGQLDSGVMHTYGYSGGGRSAAGAPTQITDERGIVTQFQYDSDFWKTRKTYSDNTFETWCYNAFKQVTRYRDREGRVTRYTYDTRGNMLTREVGLVDDPTNVDNPDPYTPSTYDRCATNDVQTADYAIYQWEYYDGTHQNAYMLAASIDGNGNRTDYQYDASHRLTKVIQPPDVASGPRAETTYTYDTAGRVQTVIGPENWGVEYFYDARSRVTKIEHADGSTERFFYGAPASGDENLLVKYKDRRGVVTNFEYDDSGRRTRTVYAAAVMDLADVESPVSDPSVTVEQTYTYLDGTDLPLTTVRSGELTEYAYDYRHRIVEATVHPNTSTSLTTISRTSTTRSSARKTRTAAQPSTRTMPLMAA